MRHCIIPAGTQRGNNVDSMLIQRQDVESTLFQSCVVAGNVKMLRGLGTLGRFLLYFYKANHLLLPACIPVHHAGLGGSVGCAVRLETRRSRVQPPPRSATFFRGD